MSSDEPEKKNSSKHYTLDEASTVKTWDLWNLLAKGVEAEILPPCVQEKKHRPGTAKEQSNEYSSAIGPISIAELHPEGLFVRLHNCSWEEQDIGDFRLQQNVEGHPAAVFHFPHRTLIPPHASLMVWAEASQRPHLPPAQFVWRGMDHLGPEPWVTTILCQVDGQAVAWYTPALCTTKSWQSTHHRGSVLTRCQSSMMSRDQKMGKEARQYPFYTPPGGVTYLDRKDKGPFLLLKRKTPTNRMSCSPWTQDPCCLTHPAYIQPGKVDFRGLPNRNNWTFLCQSKPAPAKVIIEDQHGKAASSRSRPTRSIGPCLGGLMFVGPVPPLTSPLQRYCDANCYIGNTCFSKLPNT